MQTYSIPTFKNLFQRLKRYLLLNDGYNYNNPMRLLSMYQRLEQVKSKDDALVATLGSIVVLENEQQERFSVVLRKPAQANSEFMEISVFSPLGAAVLGRKENDTCTTEVANQVQHFKVIQIIQ